MRRNQDDWLDFRRNSFTIAKHKLPIVWLIQFNSIQCDLLFVFSISSGSFVTEKRQLFALKCVHCDPSKISFGLTEMCMPTMERMYKYYTRIKSSFISVICLLSILWSLLLSHNSWEHKLFSGTQRLMNFAIVFFFTHNNLKICVGFFFNMNDHFV